MTLMYSGISQYGWMESSPTWFWCTVEKLDLMKQQFPKMGILSIPIGTRNKTGEGLQLVKDAVAWCKRNNVKAVLSKYSVAAQTEIELEDFWTVFATEFKGETAILLFDLFNEPWASKTGWYGRPELISVYEKVIDVIRAIDPSRMIGVQSYLKHEETMFWVRTNPVKRPNVVYVVHFYSHQWVTGEWWTWVGSHAWSDAYIKHDYEKAKTQLRAGMYERFGFLSDDLKLPVLITEVAFPDTTEGLIYGDDVLTILKEWGINWCYHSWYSGADRPMTLLDGSGEPRTTVQVVNNNFVDNPIKPPIIGATPFLLLLFLLFVGFGIALMSGFPSTEGK